METSKHSSFDNMIVGNCVACDGLVRIPLNANPDAIVRCPRCGDDFRLGSVLQNAAPILEVVDTAPPNVPEPRTPRVIPILDDVPEQPSDRQRGDKFSVSPILQKGAQKKKKKKRRRRSSSSSSSESNGVEPNERTRPTSVDLADKISAATKPHDAPVADSPKPQPAQPRKSKKSSSSRSKSGGLELSKVILGACLALPVAQLLIWWFAGTDPLNLGPKVGRFAPFIVPSEFQPNQEDELDEMFDDRETATTNELNRFEQHRFAIATKRSSINSI